MTDEYVLSYGTHANPGDGRCAMEWVSHLAGEPHSDHPSCVSPVLRAMCIALNDGLDHEPRQRLRPYLARTIGTAGDGEDPRRGWLAMDWLIREYTPAWLRLAGEDEAASRLERLRRVDGPAALAATTGPLADARTRARTARRQAYAAPHPAGWASGVASAIAGRDAAWACAGAAAWAAARLSIGDTCGDRARAAARASAGDAAAVALRRHRVSGEQGSGHGRGRGHAAREASRRALAPTLDALTDSALALLDRMLPGEYLVLPGVKGGSRGAPVVTG